MLGLIRALALLAIVQTAHALAADDWRLLNRATFGATPRDADVLQRTGYHRWVDQQLASSTADSLPAAVATHIASMEISRVSLAQVLRDHQQRAAQIRTLPEELRRTEQQRLQDEHLQRAVQSAERRLLRALHSNRQVHERMAWFWFNHFNVFLRKSSVRLYLPDYDETIHRHALVCCRADT